MTPLNQLRTNLHSLMDYRLLLNSRNETDRAEMEIVDARIEVIGREIQATKDAVKRKLPK